MHTTIPYAVSHIFEYYNWLWQRSPTMSDLVILLAQRLGYKPELAHLAMDHPRIQRIISHYRKAVANDQMRLHDAVDRAYGDICGRSWNDKPQRDEPKWS